NATVMAICEGGFRRQRLAALPQLEVRRGQEVTMLRHSRESVAALEPDAVQDRISSPGWRGLAVRAAQILVGVVMSVGVIAGGGASFPALAAVQPPIGFERWTDPDVGSGIDFGLTA